MIYIDSVEQLKNAIASNVEITIKAGAYDLSKPIEINGLSNIKIICEEGCVFRGVTQFLPQFEDWKGEIKRASLDFKIFEGLIVDGKTLPIARYPSCNVDEVLNGACSIEDAPITKWKNIKGGRIRALHEYDWGGNSYKILGIKDGKGWESLQTEWVGDNNRGGAPNLQKMVFENFPDLIEEKGEWCYTGGYLYYYPVGNEKSFYAVVNHCIFDIKNCSSISINGVKIQDTAATLFNYPYETPLRGDWAIQRLGAIKISDSNDITLTDLNMQNIGGNCIFVDGNCSNCTITKSIFTNSGASGIIFAGRVSSCRDYSTWDNHKISIDDSIAGPVNEEFVKNCVVNNCYFYNLGLIEKQVAAVCITIASGITVSHCTAHRLPRAGINISDGTFGGHKIEYNELFDCVRETCDHGPFNSWGRDRFWSLKRYNTTGKYGKIKKKYALLDAIKRTEIVNNRIYATRGFGIDLDDGSSNYIIKNNICIGVGVKIREGFCREVVGNLFLHSTLDVHCSFYKCDDIVKDNIFVSSQKVLNPILMNKGNNFLMENNYYLNSVPPKKYEKLPVYVKDNVQFIDYFDYSCFYSITNGKVNISGDIGAKIQSAKPQIKDFIANEKPQKHKIKGIIFSDIDEGLRSACVLPDTAGAYVVGFKLLAPRRGLKKGDVILSCDGIKITKAKELQGKLKGELLIIREQKQIRIQI